MLEKQFDEKYEKVISSQNLISSFLGSADLSLKAYVSEQKKSVHRICDKKYLEVNQNKFELRRGKFSSRLFLYGAHLVCTGALMRGNH